MPKKILLVLAHRDIQNSRVNRFLIESLRGQDCITIYNLYETYPDFFLDISREQRLLREHQALVLQYPLYWYSCPSLLKEWIDAVWERGFAWGAGGTALRDKPVQHIVSIGGSVWNRFYDNAGSFSMDEVMKPFWLQARLAGMQWHTPVIVPAHVMDHAEEMKIQRERYQETLKTLLKEENGI